MRQNVLKKEIAHYAEDILKARNFNLTKTFIQHGNMTVHMHCINVAKYSLLFSKKLERLGIKCDKRALIRGALLHDYFLYDWHDPEHVKLYNLHGFKHPHVALRNAKRDFKVTSREEEIIQKHMWPLTVIPPTCREAWIVSCADKWCSLLETFRVHKGTGVIKAGR